MNVIKRYYYIIIYKIQEWDWYLLSYGLSSILLIVFLYKYLNTNIFDYNFRDSLELILTINGLFSAILVTYFFNRISFILESKKETYNEAQVFSQKITEFRRILNTLIRFYNVWKNDNVTKSLLEHGKYKNVDYYDLKLMSFSDYKSSDYNLIKDLNEEKRFTGESELFLGMISLVYNRKSERVYQDELYKSFEKKGIYTFDFIDKCVEIDHLSRIGRWFSEGYDFIRYHHLSDDKRKYILDCARRIDNKYKDYKLNNELMAELCDDMNEHYFKELHNLLLSLRKGLSTFNKLIFSILILSLIFGVLLPFFIYFIINNIFLQETLTKLIVAINFGLMFFFVISIYRLTKKEITWS